MRKETSREKIRGRPGGTSRIVMKGDIKNSNKAWCPITKIAQYRSTCMWIKLISCLHHEPGIDDEYIKSALNLLIYLTQEPFLNFLHWITFEINSLPTDREKYHFIITS